MRDLFVQLNRNRIVGFPVVARKYHRHSQRILAGIISIVIQFKIVPHSRHELY